MFALFLVVFFVSCLAGASRNSRHIVKSSLEAYRTIPSHREEYADRRQGQETRIGELRPRADHFICRYSVP